MPRPTAEISCGTSQGVRQETSIGATGSRSRLNTLRRCAHSPWSLQVAPCLTKLTTLETQVVKQRRHARRGEDLRSAFSHADRLAARMPVASNTAANVRPRRRKSAPASMGSCLLFNATYSVSKRITVNHYNKDQHGKRTLDHCSCVVIVIYSESQRGRHDSSQQPSPA